MRISESQLRRIIRRVITESRAPVVSRRRSIDEGFADTLKQFFGDKKGADAPPKPEGPLSKLSDDQIKAVYEKTKELEDTSYWTFMSQERGIDLSDPKVKSDLEKAESKNKGVIDGIMGMLTKTGVDVKKINDVEGLIKGEYRDRFEKSDSSKSGKKKTSYEKQLRADSSSHWF